MKELRSRKESRAREMYEPEIGDQNIIDNDIDALVTLPVEILNSRN